MKIVYGRGNDVGMNQWRHSNQWIFSTMLFSALISLFAAFQLSRDAVILAGNPESKFSCDLNETISCGKVAMTWQAEILGFPNSFIGLMCEPVVITIAVAGLSGVFFKRWFMFTAQVVYLIGLVFAYWLFYQSAFVIHALCPYCLLITLGTTLVFFSLLHYNVRENNLYLPQGIQSKLEFLVKVGADVIMVILLIAIIVLIIFAKYGSTIFA